MSPTQDSLTAQVVIIDGKLVLNGERHYIKNIKTGEKVALTGLATALLLYILSRGTDVSERDAILESVFEKNGARPTEANLNQNISLLRKSLAAMGYEKELIITVPKKGFRLAECDLRFKGKTIPERETIAEPKVPAEQDVVGTKAAPSRLPLYLLVFSVFVFLLTMGAFFFIKAQYKFKPATISRTFSVDKCHVNIIGYTNVNNTDNDSNDVFAKEVLKKEDCAVEKNIYIFNYQNFESNFTRKFYGICGFKNDYYQCSSNFKYEE